MVIVQQFGVMLLFTIFMTLIYSLTRQVFFGRREFYGVDLELARAVLLGFLLFDALFCSLARVKFGVVLRVVLHLVRVTEQRPFKSFLHLRHGQQHAESHDYVQKTSHVAEQIENIVRIQAVGPSF